MRAYDLTGGLRQISLWTDGLDAVATDENRCLGQFTGKTGLMVVKSNYAVGVLMSSVCM